MKDKSFSCWNLLFWLLILVNHNMSRCLCWYLLIIILIRLPADVAISDVLLEQISQITNIKYFYKFVKKKFVKIIDMVEDMSKVLLNNFGIIQLPYIHIIMCRKTKLDKGGSPLMWTYHRHNADNAPASAQ